MSLINYLMDPTFSDSVLQFFEQFGDGGIIMLCLIKMFLIASGCLLMMAPIAPMITWFGYKLFINSLTDEEFVEHQAEKMERKIAKLRSKRIKAFRKTHQAAAKEATYYFGK